MLHILVVISKAKKNEALGDRTAQWIDLAEAKITTNKTITNLYIKNLSDTPLTDHDKILHSKSLKFIPTPPKHDSQKSNQRF